MKIMKSGVHKEELLYKISKTDAFQEFIIHFYIHHYIYYKACRLMVESSQLWTQWNVVANNIFIQATKILHKYVLLFSLLSKKFFPNNQCVVGLQNKTCWPRLNSPTINCRISRHADRQFHLFRCLWRF